MSETKTLESSSTIQLLASSKLYHVRSFLGMDAPDSIEKWYATDVQGVVMVAMFRIHEEKKIKVNVPETFEFLRKFPVLIDEYEVVNNILVHYLRGEKTNKKENEEKMDEKEDGEKNEEKHGYVEVESNIKKMDSSYIPAPHNNRISAKWLNDKGYTGWLETKEVNGVMEEVMLTSGNKSSIKRVQTLNIIDYLDMAFTKIESESTNDKES